MKIRYLFSALFSACIAFSGCSDDVFEEPKTPWQEGDNIIFGARAGLENNDQRSRTEYTGEQFVVNGHTFEQIKWRDGDKITIYSDQAHLSGGNSQSHQADYIASNSHMGTTAPEDTNYGYATFSPSEQGKALQWGNQDLHTFYACYPTYSETQTGDRYAVKITKEQDDIVLTGTVPANQIPWQIVKNESDASGKQMWLAKPVMKNAHMVAALENVSKLKGDAANLSFQSLCTAVEIELTGHADGSVIDGVLVGSASAKVAGRYRCVLNPDGKSYNAVDKAAYPTCTLDENSQTANQIYVPFLHDVNGKLRGVQLASGEKLKFTVFMLPNVDHTNLNLTIITPSGRKSHVFKDNKGGVVTFNAHKKYYFRNVKMPEAFDSADWMSRIDNNVYINQLSIPGSGSSFSYTYTGKEPHYYQTQTLSIEKQWNEKGIRCFEIISDRGSWNGSIFNPKKDLSNQNVIGAKGSDLSVTVTQAVDSIYNLVQAHPSEFAMIVMNYQPEKSRNGAEYMQSFDTFFNKWKNGKKVAKYDPMATLNSVRGHVMFFLRPTSDGEDMFSNTKLNEYSSKDYVVINGWGSLQDKWKQRGYPTTDTDPNDGVNGNSAKDDLAGSVENGIVQEGNGTGGKDKPDISIFKLPVKGTPNYEYSTNNSSLSVWAQEWNRVIPGKKDNVETLKVYYGLITEVRWVAWKESYHEKLQDAKDTFVKACANQDHNLLYFNCLTGYLSNIKDWDTETFTPAYYLNKIKYPGSSHGNVITFSDKINTDFFAYLWKQWNARKTGPLGVVMMNRIGSGDIATYPGNHYMPNVVISNNFSFPLEKATTVQGKAN